MRIKATSLGGWGDSTIPATGCTSKQIGSWFSGRLVL